MPSARGRLVAAVQQQSRGAGRAGGGEGCRGLVGQTQGEQVISPAPATPPPDGPDASHSRQLPGPRCRAGSRPAPGVRAQFLIPHYPFSSQPPSCLPAIHRAQEKFQNPFFKSHSYGDRKRRGLAWIRPDLEWDPVGGLWVATSLLCNLSFPVCKVGGGPNYRGAVCKDSMC